MSETPVIVAEKLTRLYGKKLALDAVDIVVPEGCVFGLVGENGAGKTTFIKHCLGLLKPHGGSIRVFGLDPVQTPEKVLAGIGYLSEDHDLPNWMRVGELMRYMQAFYPKWDEKYAEELRDWFDLDPRAKVRTLSRGQRAKAGLLVALAHRPPLLLLDEPSSGLDAVVRRDILGAIVRTVAEEGRTVVFSSHLLDEVERVADRVVMISGGKAVLSDKLDDLKERHRAITLRFPEAVKAPPSWTGALGWSGHGRDWTVVCDGALDSVKAQAVSAGAEVVSESVPSLEDIFVARAGRKARTEE
ncbi:MAG: hypothetical protein AMXMBFR84_39240 [Candidatus Hydrogenedentota bacterium]